MTTRICKVCRESKKSSEFYKGLACKCKECHKQAVRLNYRNRIDQYRAYEKVRYQRPDRKAKALDYQRKRRAKYPEKEKARRAVSYYKRRGIIKPPKACQRCKAKGRVEAHHDDYSKPLQVQWLCFICHRKHGHGQQPVWRKA